MARKNLNVELKTDEKIVRALMKPPYNMPKVEAIQAAKRLLDKNFQSSVKGMSQTDAARAINLR